MKRFLALAFFLFAGSVFAATGDIVSATIRSDGWSADIVISGLNVGGTYDFGLGTNNDPATGTPKVVFTVVSLGYDSTGAATTKTRTIYGTHAVRKAYPNQASNDESFSTNTTVRIALSDYVYAKDTTGAGNSGTAPTVTILSGFYTYSGTPNNATTALTVTDSSTLAYPASIVQWDGIAGVRTADRVKADFYVAVNARHRFGVAAVRFDATGQTSSATTGSTVTTETATQRSATSLYASAFRAQLAISGFTQAELISLRARVYPNIGDSGAVIDTDSYTTTLSEGQGRNKPVIVCDKNNALDSIKYVSPTGSDSADGNTTSTPYLTLGKARSVAGVNIVYLMAGTHLGFGTVPTQTTANEWCIVQPAPGESSSTVIFQIASSNYQARHNRLMFKGLKIRPVSTSAWQYGENTTNFLRYRDCIFDRNSIGRMSGGPPFDGFAATYIENCTGDLGWYWYMEQYSTNRCAFLLDGVVIDGASTGTSNTINSVWRMVACKSNNGFCLKEPASNSLTLDNIFIESNAFYKCGNTGDTAFEFSKTVSLTVGLNFSNNVVEVVTNVAPLIAISQYSTSSTNNVILWNNSTAGQRGNLAQLYTAGGNQTHTNWSVRNNSIGTNTTTAAWETVGDTEESNNNGALIGNYPIKYSVGWSNNTQPTFINAQLFNGLKTIQGSQPAYVTDASYNGTAAGGGDYHLATSSPAKTLTTALLIPYDIAGAARSAVDAVGAYHYSIGNKGGFFRIMQ